MKYKPYKYLALTGNNTLYYPHNDEDGRKRKYWYFRGNKIESIRRRILHEIKLGYVSENYIVIDAATHTLVWSMNREVKTAREWLRRLDDFGDNSTVEDFLSVATRF